MPNTVTDNLPELRPHSNVSLPASVVCGIDNCFSGPSFQLIEPAREYSSQKPNAALKNGVNSLPSKAKATRLRQKLPPGAENNLTYLLNDALLGGEQYPITTMIGGIIAGAVSAGAGFLFALTTTALSMSQTSRRILARENDEIWQVEEIGKVKSQGVFSADSWDVVHVGSYFLVDPFRGKAWLIHEVRSEIVL